MSSQSFLQLSAVRFYRIFQDSPHTPLGYSLIKAHMHEMFTVSYAIPKARTLKKCQKGKHNTLPGSLITQFLYTEETVSRRSVKKQRAPTLRGTSKNRQYGLDLLVPPENKMLVLLKKEVSSTQHTHQ